jgi:hypothetical protein
MSRYLIIRILVLGIVFLFVSCQAILRKVYDLKNPAIENEKTILNFAKKYNLDTNNIVSLNAVDYPEFISGKSIPDADVFDMNGNYIEYRQTDTSCNAGLFQFIPDLNLNGQYNKTTKTSLNSIFPKLRNLKGETLEKLAPADFYVLIYWTVYTGKLNKDHVKIWEEQATKNTNAKIKILKVNLDIQENWGKSQTDKYIEALKKAGKKKK